MEIKIIGEVSLKRDYLYTVVQTAISELHLDVEIIKIEDNNVIRVYDINQTPVFVIDEKVIYEGKVPGITEIKKIIKKLNDLGSE